MRKPKFYMEIFEIIKVSDDFKTKNKKLWGARIMSRNGEIVYSSTSQGYESRALALKTARRFAKALGMDLARMENPDQYVFVVI